MADKQGWFRCSVVGLAALYGVPNIDFPLGGIIDLIFGQIDGGKQKKARKLAEHTAGILAALKLRHEDAAVESARLTATKLLRDFGLSDRAFADLALDADKAAAAVLDRATFTVDERAEILPLCRKILASFYESVLQEPSLLGELLPQIHAATLRNFDDLKTGQEAIRISQEKMALQFKELREIVGQNQVEDIQRENHLTQAALANMFSILKEQKVQPEHLDAKLRQIAERHVELTERLHALAKSNDEPEITKRREQAAKAIEQGDYDRADRLLAEAEDIDRQAISEQQQAIVEQQEALDRRQLSAATTLIQRGELERTRLNYRKAADHFAEAVSLVPTSDSETRLDYLMKQASALDGQGTEFGDNRALLKAIETYQTILDAQSRKHVPFKWAEIQNDLGNAFWTLGQRETDTERLEQAINAFQAALEEFTREKRPFDWAKTQNNLGNALWTLGQRETGTTRLEQAINAFQAALEEWKRERVPLEWAKTQNNLGIALRNLGERESGTERLKQAVEALQLALKVRTRERMPLEWARTQNNLGNALWTLGQRETGTTRLEQAVNAFQAALEEWKRERVPPEWAMAQNNLGNALANLGRRNKDVGTLEQAVASCRNALLEWTRDRTPMQWAIAQDSLGNALTALGVVTRDTSNIEEAVEAYQQALEAFRKSDATAMIAETKANIISAETLLAEIKSGSSH